MAKNPVGGQTLSFVDIVMHADAETIKAAYEARVKVDGLLAEREEAYRKIAELEQKVEAVLTSYELFFHKSETWIEEEKMYEVLYELTV